MAMHGRKGVSTSVIVRKLGTLADLLVKHGPTRDHVVAWEKEMTKSFIMIAAIITLKSNKRMENGKRKKQRKNPHDPARFIGTIAVTDEGEAAKIHSYLDESKIESEAPYDGLYSICTDLLDDVSAILKVSEGRWQIEECFRIMKTDFAARPVYLRNENRIKLIF